MEENKVKKTVGRPLKSAINTNEINEVMVEQKKKLDIRNLPLHTTVRVRSNVFGELIYVSTKSNYKVSWNDNSTPLYFTLDELLIMRNTQPKFFRENWIVIDGFVDEEYANVFSADDIYDYLQVAEYYKSFLCPENIDDLFRMKPNDIVKKLKGMSNTNKDYIILRANQLIEDGTLDSLKVISTLEKELGCELYKKE
jgi:hypothetical protein